MLTLSDVKSKEKELEIGKEGYQKVILPLSLLSNPENINLFS